MSEGVLILTKRLERGALERFRDAPFEKMIKFVADVARGRLALGGEMHSDAEEALLRTGSRQADLWGGNLWPWDEPPRIEHISLINIRPAQDNPGMEIEREDVRTAVRAIVEEWVELR